MARIKELKADVRLKGKPAHIHVNGYLAIAQIELKSEIQALEWVLQPRVKPKKGWTRDEWSTQKTLKTEMIGSIERAVCEVERRYEGKDMPYDLAKLYETARDACESYESNRRKPPRTKLWGVYYDLVKRMEQV